jgi:hypothetical protein
VSSGFIISIYWINRQAEFTINYSTLNLTVITCVNSSQTGFLFASVLLVPIRCPVCVLLAASIHRIHFLSGTSWELVWTELKLVLKLKLASFGTRYITSAPTTQKTAPPLLLKHVHYCIATVAELTREQVMWFVAGEFIGASLPSNDKRTLVLLMLRAFRGFYASTVTAWGKHGTIYNNKDSCVDGMRIVHTSEHIWLLYLNLALRLTLKVIMAF